ncbi:MAG TPA: alpha/beta hydrolase [Kofleriaceae bacterium]|nr:alpha/beta hydrolase [Kofleriaceae bacterium]
MKWSTEHGMVVRRTGGDGPRIVWIHGLGESSVSFEPVVAKMPAFSHVMIDLPGYGRSAWPDAATNLETLADHLASWLSSAAPAFLVGHSMGGVLATLVAERATVAGIVNIDGNISSGDCTFSAKASAYSLADFRDQGFGEMRAQVYADGMQRPELRTYHAAMCLAHPESFHRHAGDLVEMSATNTLGPRLAALTCPALFVAGVPDGVCVETRRQLTELKVRWVGIEPAGHWVYLDQLDKFVAELSRFLR